MKTFLSVIALFLFIGNSPLLAQYQDSIRNLPIAERFGSIYNKNQTLATNQRIYPLFNFAITRLSTQGQRIDLIYDRTTGEATPGNIDDLVKKVQTLGTAPLLDVLQYTRTFGHPESYPMGDADHPNNEYGEYYKWYKIGKSMADRYKPGSDWNVAQGHGDWGIELYMIFNEIDGDWYWRSPDQSEAVPVSLEAYYQMNRAFADGVHASDPELKVYLGPLAGSDAWVRDTDLHPTYPNLGWKDYLRAAAPLFNNGTLEGLGYQLYWNEEKVIEGKSEPFADKRATQRFKEGIAYAGITSDPVFYGTELGVQKDFESGNGDDERVARYAYTQIWDYFSVTSEQGEPNTHFAMPFNAMLNNSRDLGLRLGFTQSYDPYHMNARGRVYAMVSRLIQDTRYESIDQEAGTVVLTGEDKKIWVFQNYDWLSNQAGSSFTVEGVPAYATQLEVYRYNANRQAPGQEVELVLIPEQIIPVADGQSQLTLEDLPADETVMIVATATPIATLADACFAPIEGTRLVPRREETRFYWEATNGPVASYELRYRVLGNETWFIVAGISDTTTTVGGLGSGTNYEWQVRAVCEQAATDWSKAESFTVPLGVSRSANAPQINGQLSESEWQLFASASKPISGEVNNEATFGLLWDENYLYVGVQVQDDALLGDSDRGFQDDAVEVFLDINNNGGDYDSTDNQFTLSYGSDSLVASEPFAGEAQFAWSEVKGGYAVEFAFPWEALGVVPEVGFTLGFDVAIDDDDDGEGRDAQQVWAGTNKNFNSTSGLGDITLLEDFTPIISKPIAEVLNTPVTPLVDGTLEALVWEEFISADKVTNGTVNNEAAFALRWDTDYLYVGVRVEDADLVVDSDKEFNDDGIVIHIDADGNGGGYDSTDNRFILPYNGDLRITRDFAGDVAYAWSDREEGYSVEVAIPWAGLGIDATSGASFGFDLAVDDDDNGGNREGRQVWAGTKQNFKSTAGFGVVRLLEVAGKPVKEAQRTSTTPTVDGLLETSVWNRFTSAAKVTNGQANNEATFGLLWDEDYLYVGVQVQDTALVVDSEDEYQDDGIVVHVDANGNGGSYDSTDNRFILPYNGDLRIIRDFTGEVAYAWAETEEGYSVEAAIPWGGLGIDPINGFSFGFDLAVDDDDDGGNREGRQVWAGTGANFKSTEDFGIVTLVPPSLGGGAEGNITVWARGDCGTEVMELHVDGQPVARWENVSTQLSEYSYDGYQGGEVSVHFVNDFFFPGQGECEDRNLTVDYIEVCGVTYQTEEVATETAECCFYDKEKLYTNGNFNFGDPGCGSDAATNARSERTQSTVQVYPNPAEEQLTVVGGKDYRVVVYDLIGRPVMQHDGLRGRARLEVAHLLPGVYLLTVQQGGHRSQQRIVIE